MCQTILTTSTEVITAITHGFSDEALKYSFKLTDEQIAIARKEHKEVTTETSSSPLTELKSFDFNKANIGADSVEDLTAKIHSLTSAVVAQAGTLLSSDIDELKDVMVIAERASKVIKHLYGEAEQTVNFESFALTLKG